MLPLIEIYTKDECCLCDEAKAVLSKVKKEIDFELREIKIQDDAHLIQEYGHKIPVVFINGRLAFKHHIYELELKEKLYKESS